LVMSSGGVRAAVSVEDLSVSDASFTAEQITPEMVVTAAYSYDVGETAISALRFTLSVGGSVIDTTTLDTTHTRSRIRRNCGGL